MQHAACENNCSSYDPESFLDRIENIMQKYAAIKSRHKTQWNGIFVMNGDSESLLITKDLGRMDENSFRNRHEECFISKE